ncbi:MAG: hybrid sensor histidine kinase/response regulator [Chloroflexi bacterium]|nr:hybrid sensor histidine kinase/response regulator [Chloroflexota bacterium]
MLDHILNQVTEQTRDDGPLLAEFATRSEPFANDLFAAWNEICRAAGAPPTAFDETFRAFFGELKQSNLRGAYAAFGAWGMDAARARMEYAAALQLIRESQRALLPFVLRAYADAPQLPLLLDALGAAFDGLVTIVGAAYVTTAPERFADGVPAYTLGQLTGGAAHTLNNLLAAILGRTQLLIERTDDHAWREELEAIQSTAATGARIVRRMQDYLQTAGAAENPAADVNLALRDAAELTRFVWRDQAEARGIVIDVVKDFADVPPAQIALSDLRRVLVALILNAAEALTEGGRIALRTERKDDQVVLAIIDDGAGMSDAVRTRLGEPGVTTKAAPHLGMGWNIVAKICKQFHGTWSIESKSGQGTTVTLALPLAKRIAGGKIRSMTATRAANILVIDNEPSVRDLLARLLKLHGHTVATAESGAEGIATFKAGKFDLVFTDLGMPEMSGWDVAREIKNLNAKTRVGLITGWPIDLTRDELRARGVDQVVAKPFDLPALLSLIEDAVALSDKKQAGSFDR